jgi:hypothetical protein
VDLKDALKSGKLRRGPELAEEMLICAAWRVRVTKKPTSFHNARQRKASSLFFATYTWGNLEPRQGETGRRAAKEQQSEKRQGL